MSAAFLSKQMGKMGKKRKEKLKILQDIWSEIFGVRSRQMKPRLHRVTVRAM